MAYGLVLPVIAPLQTAVLLIVFRRADTTAKVIAALRAVQPAKLYVAADGPAANDPIMAMDCEATRALVTAQVDWPCQLFTSLAQSNLGCRAGVTAALDWFFTHESEGIILEDDVVPEVDFFVYCSELLQRYQNDSRVGAITGHNPVPHASKCASSYFFSNFNQCWGWASWRRAWRCYDRDLQHWPSFRDRGWLRDVGGPAFAAYFSYQLERVRQGRCDTWDYIWSFSLWRQGMVACVPAVNLVNNIGMGHPTASHTRARPSRLDGRTTTAPTRPLDWPLRHSQHFVVDRHWEQRLFRHHHRPPLWRRLVAKAWRLLRRDR